MKLKITPLTAQELANVEDGLTTDGRKIEPCPHHHLNDLGESVDDHFGCFLDEWGLSK